MLGDRAGWVLESITYRDFGFSDGVNAFAKEDPLRAAARRAAARKAVVEWWARAQSGWTCYDALAEALRSDRPRLAYSWLRDRRAAPCPGFTHARFEQELAQIVKQHAADATHPFRDQAKHLLDEAADLADRGTTVSQELALARVAMMTPDTTVQELEETIGKPTRDIGSGIHIFVYKLRDSEAYTLRVGTADGSSILHVSLDVSGNARQVWKR